MHTTKLYPSHLLGFLSTRRTTLPRRLIAPAPDEIQLKDIFQAAASAPDHGKLTPWRFIAISDNKRQALGDAFVKALILRNENASEEDLQRAREKAQRAPFVALAVAKLNDENSDESKQIPADERLISLGCAMQNILLAAHAHGFGSSFTSGKSLQSSIIREFFNLDKNEKAICFINIGTISSQKPAKPRADVNDYLKWL